MTGDGTGPIAAVDHAVARLATDVGRLDAIDLAAPWIEDRRCRRDRLLALIRLVDDASVPEDTSHGSPLASALVQAWSQRRARLEREPVTLVARATVELLAEIHDVHVDLDVGVRPHDLPVFP